MKMTDDQMKISVDLSILRSSGTSAKIVSSLLISSKADLELISETLKLDLELDHSLLSKLDEGKNPKTAEKYRESLVWNSKLLKEIEETLYWS